VIPLEFPIVAGAMLKDVNDLKRQLLASFRVVMGLEPEAQAVCAPRLLSVSVDGKGGGQRLVEGYR
jgi:hypothetical protein